MILEASGWAGSGVDLFFVLSGFLITGILVDAKGSENYFRRFYWRRSLRIFPAFYALLVFAIVRMRYLFRNIGFIWFAFYLRNWFGADEVSDGRLGHLWSLAVEEQFYIAWSVVVFLCPSRYLVRVILVLLAVAPLVRGLMHHLEYPGYLIFRVTPARMDSLLFGALVAVAIRSGWISHGRRLALLGLQAGLAGLLILRFFLGPLSIDVAGYQVAGPSLTALSFASLVFLCLHLREKMPAHRLLTCYPFRIVAKYSYAIYLWHLVAVRIVAVRLPVIFARLQLSHGYALAFIASASCLSFAMAASSWLLIEAPALRLKDHCFSFVRRKSGITPS
jgi:peptidoglycan/LPS O-acetylase OafA/YrhL